MAKIIRTIELLFLLTMIPLFLSCSLFNEKYLDITFEGAVVGSNLTVRPRVDFELTIHCEKGINLVEYLLLGEAGDVIDDGWDLYNNATTTFDTTVTLAAPKETERSTLSLTVNDSSGRQRIRQIEIDCYTTTPPEYFGRQDQVIPEISIANGGYQSGSGEIYYFNTPLHRADRSDVRISYPDDFSITTKRYLRIRGEAVPYDSGFTDRGYHTVDFGILPQDIPGVGNIYRTLIVDADDQFDAYLYFPAIGKYKVYAYRSLDDCLYPKTGVPPGYSTLYFEVNATEGVPTELHYLLPSRCVDVGIDYVRLYADQITEFCVDDAERAQAIFYFLVFGDSNGQFVYTSYDDMYPGYLDTSYSTIFIASDFLLTRRGVCNDFAELFAALCRSVGLQVQLISGDNPNGVGHQWNQVNLDGEWNRCDATFANGYYDYRRYAEFYDAFDETNFVSTHEDIYSDDFRVEW